MPTPLCTMRVAPAMTIRLNQTGAHTTNLAEGCDAYGSLPNQRQLESRQKLDLWQDRRDLVSLAAEIGSGKRQSKQPLTGLAGRPYSRSSIYRWSGVRCPNASSARSLPQPFTSCFLSRNATSMA